MTRRLPPFALIGIAALSVCLAVVPAGTQNANNPIPGVDIIVQKKPGGTALVAGATGRDGRFSARVRVEPSEYEVSGACRTRRTCPPFRLTSVRIDGRTLSPDVQRRFNFTVRPGAPSALIAAVAMPSMTR